MFERFTDQSRRVVVIAQEEARFLDHACIGTEHLLLGLLGSGHGAVADVLGSLGVTLEAVRARAADDNGRLGRGASGHIPFTARATRVLEVSLQEARALGFDDIHPEHLLLAMIRDDDCGGMRILGELGFDPSQVRTRTMEVLSAVGEQAQPLVPVGAVPASCGFCGRPSKDCGALYMGVGNALICEACLRRGAEVAAWDEAVAAEAESPADHRNQREVTAAPPTDEARARLDIRHAFLDMNERSDGGRSLRNVDGGTDLGLCADQAAAGFAGLAGRVTQTVDNIRFFDARHAAVVFTLHLDGSPLVGFRRRDGRAVVVDGGWKVARETACELFAAAGVDCPPRLP